MIVSCADSASEERNPLRLGRGQGWNGEVVSSKQICQRLGMLHETNKMKAVPSHIYIYIGRPVVGKDMRNTSTV